MKKFFFILVAGCFLFSCGCANTSSLHVTANAVKQESFLGYSPAYDVHVTYSLVSANR